MDYFVKNPALSVGVLYFLMQNHDINVFLPYIVAAIAFSAWANNENVHRQQAVAVPYKYTAAKNLAPAQMSQWSSKYDNPLYGAPAQHLLALPKMSDKDIFYEMQTGMAQKESDLYTMTQEKNTYSRYFNQMPDPTLQNYRGVTFDDGDQLPNDTLVLESDFGGAVASNATLRPSVRVYGTSIATANARQRTGET